MRPRCTLSISISLTQSGPNTPAPFNSSRKDCQSLREGSAGVVGDGDGDGDLCMDVTGGPPPPPVQAASAAARTATAIGLERIGPPGRFPHHTAHPAPRLLGRRLDVLFAPFAGLDHRPGRMTPEAVVGAGGRGATAALPEAAAPRLRVMLRVEQERPTGRTRRRWRHIRPPIPRPRPPRLPSCRRRSAPGTPAPSTPCRRPSGRTSRTPGPAYRA